MSEYWVSKKRYYCKYCEIYIADDAPSRQQHENGLRHKGNVDRFIRGIYKSGEKRKKDLEEEKRDMVRVEQAAQAAFAQDIGAGHALPAAPGSPPVASSAPRKPSAKPSNPMTNYSTAESLGYTDPDADRLAAELEVRLTQGVAGEWQLLPAASSVPSGSDTPQPAGDGAAAEDYANPLKREAEGPPPEEDSRHFKLSKKRVAAGLGEIYDPGVIQVKPKKKEEAEPLLAPVQASSSKSTSGEMPKWTSIQLKPGMKAEGEVKQAENGVMNEEGGEANDTGSASGAKKWVKVSWGAPLKEEEVIAPMPEVKNEHPQSSDSPPLAMKKEEEENGSGTAPPPPEPAGGGGLFRKRKTPAGAGRGRRQV